MQRRFIDAPNELRCEWNITLRDGSKAQCGRYCRLGEYHLCAQHKKMHDAMRFPCCGGNDELPPGHCMDCEERTTTTTTTTTTAA
jgi:hypothetical protein